MGNDNGYRYGLFNGSPQPSVTLLQYSTWFLRRGSLLHQQEFPSWRIVTRVTIHEGLSLMGGTNSSLAFSNLVYGARKFLFTSFDATPIAFRRSTIFTLSLALHFRTADLICGKSLQVKMYATSATRSVKILRKGPEYLSDETNVCLWLLSLLPSRNFYPFALGCLESFFRFLRKQ